MRQWNDVLDLRPLLIGTLSVSAGSSIGDTIDTLGFADMLVVMQWAVTGGTAAAQGYLSLKFQEGADPAGTGGDMTDIVQGQITGTMSFDMTADGQFGTALTYPYLASTAIYERLSLKRDGGGHMGRYIRPICTLVGTTGCNHVYAVSVLLGRPTDSTLIQNAVKHVTTSLEFQKAQWEGA